MIIAVNSLDRIRNAAASAFNIPHNLIYSDETRGNVPQAQCMFAQLSRAQGYAVVEIAAYMKRTTRAIYTLLECAKSNTDSNPKYKDRLRKAAERLAIDDLVFPKPKTQKKAAERKYHPPFCTYTEEEELAYRVAIIEANRFMEKYGKGQQPLRPGFATRRKSS